jgi:hypothetical protein
MNPTLENYNSTVKVLTITAPKLDEGSHSVKLVGNLTAKQLTTKKGDALQIIEVPCEANGQKFNATLLSESPETFITKVNINDAIQIFVSINDKGYKTATI